MVVLVAGGAPVTVVGRLGGRPDVRGHDVARRTAAATAPSSSRSPHQWPAVAVTFVTWPGGVGANSTSTQ